LASTNYETAPCPQKHRDFAPLNARSKLDPKSASSDDAKGSVFLHIEVAIRKNILTTIKTKVFSLTALSGGEEYQEAYCLMSFGV
jgi:hypothetical protein